MIYFDNSATSYPKPKSVISQTIKGLNNFSFNSGRAGYKQSIAASEKIFETRSEISGLFDFPINNIVFTKNCTEALNIAIRGSVKQGEHIIISSLEHNSVYRVVHSMFINDTIDYDIAAFSFDEDETVSNFEKLIKDNTAAIVCMHSSNVFGVCFPIKKIGELCSKRGITFIVDAAQGAGVADINANRDNIDVLCCAGHKCLMGPMGSGFLAFKQGVKIDPLMYGGTGSESFNANQPDYSPDRFESGTLNNPAIIGLGEGINQIKKIGIENIYEHELQLCDVLYDGLLNIDGIKLYTPKPKKNKSMPIISFNVKDKSSEYIADLLSQKGICTRAGYHCAPLAHKHFKTESTGTVRISPGLFNSYEDCYRFINVVKKL
ncbi:MAG: aminotransferase class V-fold PLP-dependent enzyme [Ruminococcaceae bacterium]|nr:aminotransferase class V-fold PLP-dependent enzyme [Oscillospiraceae bacterium]